MSWYIYFVVAFSGTNVRHFYVLVLKLHFYVDFQYNKKFCTRALTGILEKKTPVQFVPETRT